MGQDERHVHFIFFIGLFVFFLAGLAFPALLNAIRIDEGWSQFLGHQRTAEDKRGNKRGSWQIRVWHWDAVLFGPSGPPGLPEHNHRLLLKGKSRFPLRGVSCSAGIPVVAGALGSP